MISDLVEMLDRQHAFMRAQGDVDLLRHMPRYVALLSRDVRIVAVLDELFDEAISDLRKLNDERRAIAAETIRLRDHFFTLAPDADDRGAEHDASFENRADYRRSFRNFDELIAEPEVRWPDVRERDADRDPLEDAIGLLARRIPNPDDRRDDSPFNGLGLQVGNQQRRRGEVQRRYELLCFNSPAVAAIRIRQCAARLTPPAEVYEEKTLDYAGFVNAALNELRSFDGITRRVVFGQDVKGDAPSFAKAASAFRADLDLLHEELRAKIALKRSLRTLVHRYRTRAQWYDAAELRKIARRNIRVEDALTADFARYMHDCGLNPLTRPMLGPLQPDLFDPVSKWSFYIEAKQYSGKGSPTSKLVRGMHQVWDTLAQQRGTAYEVREAFYLVFRLGGPRVVFPREVHSEGTTVYPVVIDIADSKSTGSRQRDQPIEIAAGQLLPMTAASEASPAAGFRKRPVKAKRNAPTTKSRKP